MVKHAGSAGGTEKALFELNYEPLTFEISKQKKNLPAGRAGGTAMVKMLHASKMRCLRDAP